MDSKKKESPTKSDTFFDTLLDTIKKFDISIILYYIIYGLSWKNTFNDPTSELQWKVFISIIIFIIILVTSYYGISSILSKMYDNDEIADTKDLKENKPYNQLSGGYIADQIAQFFLDTKNTFNVTLTTDIIKLPDISYNLDLSFSEFDISFSDYDTGNNHALLNTRYAKIYNKLMIKMVTAQIMGFIMIFGVLIMTIIILNKKTGIANPYYNFYNSVSNSNIIPNPLITLS